MNSRRSRIVLALVSAAIAVLTATNGVIQNLIPQARWPIFGLFAVLTATVAVLEVHRALSTHRSLDAGSAPSIQQQSKLVTGPQFAEGGGRIENRITYIEAGPVRPKPRWHRLLIVLPLTLAALGFTPTPLTPTAPASPKSTPAPTPTQAPTSTSTSKPSTPQPVPRLRDLLSVTLAVTPPSGFRVDILGVWSRAQYAIIQGSPSDGTRYVAALLDQGVDTAPLRAGTPDKVAGHAAYYLAEGPSNYGWIGTTLVAWPQPSGSWAVVGGCYLTTAGSCGAGVDRGSLTRLAAAVTTGPVRRLTAPYTFGYLPKDLAVFGVRKEVDNGNSGVSVGRYVGTNSEENAITINAYGSSGPLPPTSLQVAGRPAEWTATTEDGGSKLSVYFDGFALELWVDKAHRDAYQQTELTRIVEGLRFADFRDQAKWLDPRPR